jgi:hypothetical protein
VARENAVAVGFVRSSVLRYKQNSPLCHLVPASNALFVEITPLALRGSYPIRVQHWIEHWPLRGKPQCQANRNGQDTRSHLSEISGLHPSAKTEFALSPFLYGPVLALASRWSTCLPSIYRTYVHEGIIGKRLGDTTTRTKQAIYPPRLEYCYM